MEKEYNCQKEDIICCMGPSIRECHFEVENEVVEQFRNEFQDIPIEQWLKKGRVEQGKQKYQIDTIMLNRKMLEKIGLKPEHIIDSGICTVCQQEQFHSYRAKGKQAKRNVGIIGLK